MNKGICAIPKLLEKRQDYHPWRDTIHIALLMELGGMSAVKLLIQKFPVKPETNFTHVP